MFSTCVLNLFTGCRNGKHNHDTCLYLSTEDETMSRNVCLEAIIITSVCCMMLHDATWWRVVTLVSLGIRLVCGCF